MYCLFAQIPAITMVAGKSRHTYFSPKTYHVTISTKQNLKNTLKTPINQFINVKNPKKGPKTQNQTEFDFSILILIQF
jgi:hypothetical protein